MTVWLLQRRRALLILLTSIALVAFIACEGDPGTAGAPGPAGTKGVTGDAGDTGDRGATGGAGVTGSAGGAGPTGARGGTGATGPAGAAGISGQTGIDGSAGSVGPPGVTGSAGADGANVALGAVVVHDSGGDVAGSVAEGNTIDVILGGFGDGEVIALQIAHAGGTDTLDAGSVVANSSGAFAALNISIPSSLSSGDVASVWATGDAGTVGVGTLRVTSGSLALRISELGGSGQSGTAVLVASGSQTNVVVNVGGGAAGVGQPIHIHAGTCEDLGGVNHPLTALLNGRSETTVDVSLQTLIDGRFAINLHESPSNAGNYTACGTVGIGTLIQMKQLGGSGQSGSAILASSGSQTNVIVRVAAGAAGVGQPLHIHSGTCGDGLGGVVHPLTALLDGQSDTTVDVSLQTLLNGEFAINLHESPSNAGNYTSCGGI